MSAYAYLYEQKEQQQLIQKLVNEPLFQPFVGYFFDHSQEEVTLRKLKQIFPNEKKLEFFIDQLIQAQLLERKQRRYRLTFPVFSTKTNPSYLKQLPIEQEFSILSFLNQLESATVLYLLGEWLWSVLFEKEQAYFLAVDQEIHTSLLLKTEASAQQGTFVTIHSPIVAAPDLAIYFDRLAKGQTLPETYQPLERLLGDVSIDYFVSQSIKIQRSLKRSTNKRNIFKEALQITKDIQLNEEGQAVFATTIIETDQFLVLPEECSQAEELITHRFITQKDTNLRILDKMYFYQAVITTYWSAEQPLHYFKK